MERWVGDEDAGRDTWCGGERWDETRSLDAGVSFCLFTKSLSTSGV
jgi:hypothetical protein